MPTLARLGEISKGLSRNQISGIAAQILRGIKAEKLEGYGAQISRDDARDAWLKNVVDARIRRRNLGVRRGRVIAEEMGGRKPYPANERAAIQEFLRPARAEALRLKGKEAEATATARMLGTRSPKPPQGWAGNRVATLLGDESIASRRAEMAANAQFRDQVKQVTSRAPRPANAPTRKRRARRWVEQ